MSKTLEIYLTDLTKGAQVEVLAFLKYKSKAEGNFDQVPLFVLEVSKDFDEEAITLN